jgi:hypothetical protein
VSLSIVPVTFRQASHFVAQFHRHNKPARGCKFAIGVVDETKHLRGVATVGRPIARAFDDGFTAEVNRTCTDGCKNANSFLYAACWRICREMGYRRLITYTQNGETGVSLRAAGWQLIAQRAPRGNWANSSQSLRHLRDFTEPEGIQRNLWAVPA